jgi:hypothetical protein
MSRARTQRSHGAASVPRWSSSASATPKIRTFQPERLPPCQSLLGRRRRRRWKAGSMDVDHQKEPVADRVPLREPRRLTPKEREVLDFLLAGPLGRGELRDQARTAHVAAVCSCGCPSVWLEVDPATPSARFLPDESTYGRSDAVDITAVQRKSRGSTEVTLHVVNGRLYELEIGPAATACGRGSPSRSSNTGSQGSGSSTARASSHPKRSRNVPPAVRLCRAARRPPVKRQTFNRQLLGTRAEGAPADHPSEMRSISDGINRGT